MSVYLTDVVLDAGYDFINNADDAKWLLSQKDEFLVMCDKAEEAVEEYEEYLDYVEIMGDAGRVNEILEFEDWQQNKQEDWQQNNQK